jgi:hypothetical protein
MTMKITLDRKMKSITQIKKKQIKGQSGVVYLSQKSKADPESLLNYTEKLIDHLDEYRMKLENRHTGLGDVHLLVRSMKVMQTNLAFKIRHIDGNTELTELLQSALQIVTAEISAFENGCYLN